MPQYTEPLQPLAQALNDYFGGDTSATLLLHSDLGEHDELPTGVFFREPPDLFAFDEVALDLCEGRVLDVGACTGVHSLVLQERGLSVLAIDVVPQAVGIMQQRGVREALLLDFFELDGETFDTLLLLMNGTGISGTLKGLDRLLNKAASLLAPGGQVLVDSAQAQLRGDSFETSGDWPPREEGGYIGEAWIQLEYGGERGPPFRELYVDYDNLVQRATSGGWNCELAYRDGGGYLAQLRRTKS